MSAPAMQIVFVRHGRSEWNQSGRFTGWADIPLGDAGHDDAAHAGTRLARAGLQFDEVHHSVLMRTRQTADALLHAMQHPAVPYFASWRLNERHYGQLQGMNHHQITAAWGEENFHLWRRGYHHAPPPLESDDPRHPHFDARYAALDPAELPASESLHDCQRRLLPYWFHTLVPAMQHGRRLLVIAHGNTLRSMIMHLEHLTPDTIEKVEVSSGVPLVYQLDERLCVLDKNWLE